MTSSKLQPCLLKQPLKTQENLKELEIMYQNAIYLCISWYSKICWFPVKKSWCQQKSKDVSCDSFFQYNCAKFHHCRCVCFLQKLYFSRTKTHFLIKLFICKKIFVCPLRKFHSAKWNPFRGKNHSVKKNHLKKKEKSFW